MSRVVHFEIHAENPERAIRFYSSIFGWEFTPWGPPGFYWTIKTGAEGAQGINGGLVPRKGPAPAEGQAVNAFPCTVGVAQLDEAISSVQRNGGQIVHPKNAVPGVGWLAYAKDTEGNIFGMLQPDQTAR